MYLKSLDFEILGFYKLHPFFSSNIQSLLWDRYFFDFDTSQNDRDLIETKVALEASDDIIVPFWGAVQFQISGPVGETERLNMEG